MLNSYTFFFFFLNTATASYSALKCVRVRMSVFVLVCVIPPAVNLPNSILTPGLPVGRKKTRVAAIEANKQNWSEITDSTRSKKPMYSLKKLYDQSHIKTWINQIISSSPSIVNCARSCCVSLIWQPA